MRIEFHARRYVQTWQRTLDRVELITRDSMMSTGAPKTLGNTIHLRSDWGGPIFQPGDTMELTDLGRELLIHEMTHVWQYQHGGLAYIGDSLWAQLKASLGSGSRDGAYDGYAAHPAGLPWEKWNPEQQASAVERYNQALRLARATPPTATPRDYSDLSTLQPYIEESDGFYVSYQRYPNRVCLGWNVTDSPA